MIDGREKQLFGNKFVKKDLQELPGTIAPFVSHIGLTFGVLAVGKHVCGRWGKEGEKELNKQENEPPKENGHPWTPNKQVVLQKFNWFVS